MSIDIEKLNRQLEAKAQRYKQKSDTDIYDKYEQMIETKEKMVIKFQMSDEKGDLYNIDENGVALCLPIEALQTSDHYYSEFVRGKYVGSRLLEVAVDRIDKNEKTVYLKSARVTPNIVGAIKAQFKAYLKEKARRFKAGEEPLKPLVVYGVIVAVSQDRYTAYVRLLNQDIKASIRISQWTRNTYPFFPEGIEDKGEPIKFELWGYNTKTSMYTLSTRIFENEDWKKVPTALLNGNGVVAVTCIDNETIRNMWFGKIDNLDVTMLGRMSHKFKIQLGRKYLCKIKKATSDSIVLIPFKEIAENGDSPNVITKEDLLEAIRIRREKENAAKKEAEEKLTNQKKLTEIEGF